MVKHWHKANALYNCKMVLKETKPLNYRRVKPILEGNVLKPLTLLDFLTDEQKEILEIF